MRLLQIIGLFLIPAFTCSAQTRLCSENTIPGSRKTCYFLNSENDVRIEYSDLSTLIICDGSYKKNKRKLTIYIENRVIQVRKNVDTTLTETIRITHSLHSSTEDSLRFSTIKYLDKEYKPDAFGTLLLPYAGGPIEIIKYQSSENFIINPQNDSQNPGVVIRLPGKNFNLYDIYWENGILPAPSEPTIIKMKKKGDKYVTKEKRWRRKEMGGTLYEFWEKIYFIENP
ncbi:MAG: hypothetical protein R3D00_27335 [Bacteroidia bacterium]